MVWLIVAGTVALALLVLIVSLLVVGGRLRPLRRAGRRLRIRAEEAERLQGKILLMQERLEALQPRVDEAAARAAALRASGVDAG